MPEGPECHMIAWKLGKWMHGHSVEHVTVHNGRYAKPRELANSMIAEYNAAAKAAGTRLTEPAHVAAHGKLVYARLGNGWAMLSTMGLSGSWVTRTGPHCGVSLGLRDEIGNTKTLWFKDQLHYGTIKFVPITVLEDKLRKLGPDVMPTALGAGGNCTQEWWKALCKRKGEWTLAKLLLDQNQVAGIGNYLKAEALYEARTSPLAQIKEFSADELERVLEAVLAVTHRCYRWKAHRGKVPGHEAGVPRFLMKVYGKGLDPNRRKVIKTKTTDGRMTHWVPEVQTAPAGPQQA